MGRKQKLTDEQWEKLCNIDLKKIATDLFFAENNEAIVTKVLKLMLLLGDARRVLKVDRISRYRFEFKVSTGRVDLILFHNNGGVTIIEAKTEGLPREIAKGIGQLFMYEAAIRKDMNVPYINKILIAPMKPENGVELNDACELAGVKFVNLPSYQTMKKIIVSGLSQ